MRTTTHNHTATMTAQKTKPTTHKRSQQPKNKADSLQMMMNNTNTEGYHPWMDTGDDEPGE